MVITSKEEYVEAYSRFVLRENSTDTTTYINNGKKHLRRFWENIAEEFILATLDNLVGGKLAPDGFGTTIVYDLTPDGDVRVSLYEEFRCTGFGRHDNPKPDFTHATITKQDLFDFLEKK